MYQKTEIGEWFINLDEQLYSCQKLWKNVGLFINFLVAWSQQRSYLFSHYGVCPSVRLVGCVWALTKTHFQNFIRFQKVKLQNVFHATLSNFDLWIYVSMFDGQNGSGTHLV